MNVNVVESKRHIQHEEPAPVAKPPQCDEPQSLSSIVQEQDKLVSYLSTLSGELSTEYEAYMYMYVRYVHAALSTMCMLSVHLMHVSMCTHVYAVVHHWR